jgi:hypothetical protein
VLSFLFSIRRRHLVLIYRCPTTARVVHSSVDASEAEVRRLSALKLSLWCPYCQAGHAILGKDIQVVAAIVPLRLSGTRNTADCVSTVSVAGA